MAENPNYVDNQSSNVHIPRFKQDLEQSRKGLVTRMDKGRGGAKRRGGDRASTNRAPGTDLENQEVLRFRLNTFDRRSDVYEYDDVQANLNASRGLRNPEFVEKLNRICHDKRKAWSDLASKPELSIETAVKKQIQRALDYYKDEMKFVKCEKMVPASLLVTHTNFYARRKGTDFSPELFFAVLENGSPQKATHCCKLDPRFYSMDGANSFEVIHCEHVKCTKCAKWADIAIGPGDSVFM